MLTTTMRAAEAADLPFLQAMLAAAFTWRDDQDVDPAVLDSPEVRHYLDGWRRPTDFGVVALRAGDPAGAAWARLLPATDPGYGFVAEGIPELTLAVASEHRGHRIGPALLEALVERARALGVPALSLSVEDGNGARAIYERQGFVVVGREGNSDTMLLTLG